MGAPTVYRWDDTDAPVLNGLAGSGWNMVKKCLVEGYGSKAAAGWTILFEDVAQQIGVIQGNVVTGTGAIFQVIDDGVHVDNYGGRSLKVSGFESMSDPITGAGQWGGGLGPGMRKSSVLTADSRPWIIIADDRAVYYFVAPTTTTGVIAAGDTYICPYFFGDGVPFLATDSYFALIFCGLDSSDSYFGWLDLFSVATRNHQYMWRDMDIGNHDGTCTLITNGPMYNGEMGKIANALPYPWYGQTVTAKPFVNNGTIYSMRGELPGLRAPCHPAPFDNFQVVPVDGADHLAMRFRCYSNRTGQMLIDLSEGFRP